MDMFGEMRADLVSVPIAKSRALGPETHMAVQPTLTDFYSSVGNNMACVLSADLDIWASVRKSCLSHSSTPTPQLRILILAVGKGAAPRQQLA